jgi:osmotically-inducible protein OsmY
MQINRIHEAQLQLHTKVHNALARSPYFAGRNLRAEMNDDDAVVLSGVLDSYYQKQMAQESILAIDGIRGVRNDIEVVGS